MKKEEKQDFTLRITQANPTQLVVILYEMLLCYLEDAVQALAESGGLSGEPDGFRAVSYTHLTLPTTSNV